MEWGSANELGGCPHITLEDDSPTTSHPPHPSHPVSRPLSFLPATHRAGFWQVVCLMLSIQVGCVAVLLTCDLSPVVGEGLHALALCGFRLSALSFMIAITLKIYLHPTPTLIKPHDVEVSMFRASRFTTFTTWSWLLLSLYFALASLCSIAHIWGYGEVPGLPGVAGSLFGVVWSMGLMSGMVAMLVLVPLAMWRENQEVVAMMLSFNSICLHNVNILLLVCELCWNRVSLHTLHAVFLFTMVTIYVVFAYFWFRHTGVYYYFFLDFRFRYTLALHAMAIGLLFLTLQLGILLQSLVKS